MAVPSLGELRGAQLRGDVVAGLTVCRHPTSEAAVADASTRGPIA